MKYSVTVSYTIRFKKELDIYASDDAEAEEKATDIVSKWTNVEDVEVTDIEEV